MAAASISTSCPFSRRRFATVMTRRTTAAGFRGACTSKSRPFGTMEIFRDRTPSRRSRSAAALQLATTAVSARIADSLCHQLQGRPAGIHVASVRDPDGDAGEGCRRLAEDIRRQVDGVDDGEVAMRTPSGEGFRLPECLSAAQAPHLEIGHRRHLAHPVEPGAFGAEAPDVDLPSCRIQPAHQLDHLALGPARREAAEQKPDRQRPVRHHDADLSN